ncbi:MAG: phytoene desaturase family protein [Candidatus Helarchaeota archaeon]|nr:NAD(P)/FAD-dependent oxidoreductase [Deltaproteobacteria bacterium]
MKKVNIVGSGIGGSGVGALLAKAGYEVELFEKNSLPGGRFCTYEKEGFKIDVGCHIVANCDKGTCGQILEQIGMPIQWTYVRDPRPVFHFMGEFIHFPKDIPKLHLPNEDVNGLLKMLATISKLTEEDIQQYDDVDVRSFISQYTTDPRVRSLFGFLIGLYFVAPDYQTSVGEWVYCQREIQKFKSSGLPIGGTIAIPKTYCKGIERYNGKIHLKTPVKRIVIENQKAIGVELSNGDFISSDLVISNAGVKETVNKLVGREHFSSEYLKLVDSYQYSLATIMVKIALKRKITNEKFIMYVSSENLEEFAEIIFEKQIPEKHAMVMVPIISNLDPTAAPEGKQLIFGGAGAPADPTQGNCNYKKWEEAILNSLRDIFPDLDDAILWVETTTPQDIRRFAGEEGVVIGISQTVGQVGKNRPKHELPIKNLYCCCADTGTRHIGGELAAESALRLYHKLTHQEER